MVESVELHDNAWRIGQLVESSIPETGMKYRTHRDEFQDDHGEGVDPRGGGGV
jgi:hypothetical protein